MFVYDLQDHKLWNRARWQEPTFHKASDLTIIHRWLSPVWKLSSMPWTPTLGWQCGFSFLEASSPVQKTRSRYVHTCAGGRGRRRAENWLQHKSLHMFTHGRSRSRGGAGAKSAPQEMGPTPNLPCPLRNRALQTIIVLKKWQIRPRPLRVRSASAPRPLRVRSASAPRPLYVYVNIITVAERECQNPPASAPQPPRACVNVALSYQKSI